MPGRMRFPLGHKATVAVLQVDPGRPYPRWSFASMAVSLVGLLMAGEGLAEPDTCSAQGGPGSVVCSGDQSAGIAVGRTPLLGGGILQTPPISRIDIQALSKAISPAAGSSGVHFLNETGGSVWVEAGLPAVPITLGTRGDNAAGIVAHGLGTPTPTQTFFTWVIPTGAGGSGGNVTVNSFAAITTDGNDAPGISARSRAGGYPQVVVSTLQSLLGNTSGILFLVDSVQGDTNNINKSVTGSNGGSFTLSNGSLGLHPEFKYDLSGMNLATLAAGDHIDTSVAYTVASGNGLAPSQAILTVRVKRLDDGSLTVQPSTYFMVYGRAYEGTAVAYVPGSPVQNGQISLQPDFAAYMTRLLSDAAVGGTGGNVVVTAAGSIETRRDLSLGQGSHGIVAQSKGGSGLGGGGGVFSGSTGNAGSPGGSVSVTTSATIHTWGEGAHGVVASSSGGDGGRGGGASFAGNGGAGGAGAKGGAVTVTNTGTITTENASAIGIFAQSVGGRGGEGGGGGWLGGGGGAGGAGTANDAVLVSSSGTIITKGDDSHGIFAQNIGGFGGGGGGAGGIVALGSDGGNAGTGGDATIHNSGGVTTGGRNANALMAQSIGGGGGSAGGSGGLVALGGDGTAGGNGGLASVSNSGELKATGLGARGIVAQSIGGGGGHGGDSGGLVAIGGDGAITSDGGTVSVTNSGKITAASNAILAESIGGGGGTGGSSGGWFGVGGNGGGGGAGNAVTVTNSGDLNTSGRNAAALFAQSVGGGGGNGGNVVAVGAFGSVAVGGAGGPGGNGGSVVVASNGGTIETQDVQSHGIYAQSVGGRGGNGGFAAAVAAGKGLAVSLAVGRTGGGGGDGNSVQVDSSSKIITHERDAYGIYAQSVGGGGGTGGFSVAASAAIQGVAASFSIGGSGGAAGDGNSVDVGKTAAIAGSIDTHGDNAHGIFAQSVGGGGGHGGLAVAGSISAGTNGSGSLDLSLGGQGGAGGAGKAVAVKSKATITTAGEKAYGIKAQSIGGGGGDGGLAVSGSIGGGANSLKLNVAVGGSGGAGSSSGTVGVETTGGSIKTEGKGAHGIFAESVGGGGGDGGLAVTGTVGLGGKTANIGIAAGGVGGSGSTGNRVTVKNAGTITTQGDEAFGIFAQSVGGGGGVGGAAVSGSANLFTNQQGYKVNVDFAFGGRGGTGNSGGIVDVINLDKGTIETFGKSAHGIFAESVGGGGGQGGSARTMSINLGGVGLSTGSYGAFNLSLGGEGGSGGDGNAVNVTNAGAITTHNTDAHGIYAQSVGAGGGAGGDGAHGFYMVPSIGLDRTPPYQQISLSIGGSAGAAGDGKVVTVAQQGSITTQQHGSNGILAQSVGGGGGVGGKGIIGITGTVGIGGKGGASGDGGRVDVSANGTIDTYGGDAYGVFAQSVGGGGGIGGSVDRGLTWLGLNHGIGLGVGVLLNGGNGGSGGEVRVTGNGVIHTRGQASVGIFAQSTGGGGGVVGDQFGYGYAGSAGGNGSGDRIIVDWTGRIVTDGQAAHGIFAQSAGGTATAVVVYDSNGNPTTTSLARLQNMAKDVAITVRGDVIASGAGADAIRAHSEGTEGNGNITVNIWNGGTVRGGSGVAAAGVRLIGGAQNRVDNTGSIATGDGMGGFAIIGGTGNDQVSNSGTVSGSVDLGGGANGFDNGATGIFNSGPSIVLGSGRRLDNAGVLSPGGVGRVQTSLLTGSLDQRATGVLAMDLSLAGSGNDHLEVTGDATLAGNLRASPVDSGYAKPGAWRRIVLTVDGVLADGGIALTAAPAAVLNWSLVRLNANQMAVDFGVNFSPAGLGSNSRKIGDYVNALQRAGGSAAFAPVAAALVAQPTVGSLDRAYRKLGPGTTAAVSVAGGLAGVGFNDALHSCRQREGDQRFLREGECDWVKVGGGRREQDGGDGTYGFRLDTTTVAAGVQRELGADTHGGFGIAYQRLHLSSDFSAADGDQVDIGAILKHRVGATKYALSASLGYGHFESRRTIDLAPFVAVARAHPQVWSVAVHGRVSRDLLSESDRYVRPALDLGIAQVTRGRFAESGAAGADLRVARDRATFVTLQPMIEIGNERKLDDGSLLRPYARFGITRYLTGNNRTLVATLRGAPDAVAPFVVSNRLDRTYADVSLGLDWLRKNGTVVRADYTGQFSDRSSAHVVGIKLAMPF